MKVGIDARALFGDRGVARYLRELLGALTLRFPGDEYRVLLAGAPAADVPSGVVTRHDPRPRRLLFAAAALTGRPRLDRLLGGDLDVLWAPAPAPLAVSADVPFVLTVHDLSFEERRGDFTPYERLWHRLARPRTLAARADRIICDSAATRDLLAVAYAVDGEHVSVIAPGVRGTPTAGEGTPTAGESAPAAADAAVFLSVGALEPRKAPELLCRAFARARADGLDAELVFAGSGRLADKLAGPGVTVLGRVTDAELDRLYAGATALVMPSWLEGFGLPPLEAAARGIPSIVSDLPVFAETLGDAALRIPPGDEPALAAALRRMADDVELRDDLAARALRAVQPLTWERAADRTRAVLAAAAGCA